MQTGTPVDKADLKELKEEVKHIALLTARFGEPSSASVMKVKLNTVLSQT